MDQLFTIANTSILPFWLLLILAPRWRWTHTLCSLAVPLILGSLYAWLVSGGSQDRAVMWYAKGYYYEAKRLGLLEETGLRT